ncbi:MAG TPA: helix-hairpin-helix domain-containing protein [Elusimicrobiota bacterium]|nr:helix-hairpin-helix domain-containing protein [Elusimicrobiota bacterium]
MLLPFHHSTISPLHASFEEKPYSARASGMGEAMTAVIGDANSLYYNPAGLRFSKHSELLTSYSQIMAMSDLTYSVAAFSFPTRRFGGWGFSYSQFGPAFYQETEIAVTNSVFLSPQASFGYTLKQSSLKLKRYGSGSAMGIDLGVAGQVHPMVHVGVSVRNANQPNLGSIPESPSQDLRAGLVFRPVAGYVTALDTVKPVNGELSYRAGQEVQLSRLLSLRFGVQTSPNRYSAGLGFRFKGGRFDYAFISHPYLESQNQMTLSWWFGSQEEVLIAPTPVKKTRGKKGSSKKKKSSTEAPTEIVDLNTASIEELTTLPGMGRVTAQKIIDFREENGSFRTIEELLNVPRFQRRMFLRIRNYITVSGGAPSAPPSPPVRPAAVTPPPEEPAPMIEEESAPAEEPVKTKRPSSGVVPASAE